MSLRNSPLLRPPPSASRSTVTDSPWRCLAPRGPRSSSRTTVLPALVPEPSRVPVSADSPMSTGLLCSTRAAPARAKVAVSLVTSSGLPILMPCASGSVPSRSLWRGGAPAGFLGWGGAADIDALREWVGAEQIIMAGGSYGGFMALEYAIRYPERVLALVLRDT